MTYNTRSPKIDVCLSDGITNTMWPLLDWSPTQGRLVWERMNFASPMFCDLFNDRFLLLKKLVCLGFRCIIAGRFCGLLNNI
jgi:hypothetical protein